MGIIEFDNVTKVYGSSRKNVAIDSLDLSIERGSFVGIMGPNGAGKSTALKVLTNIAIPTSGSTKIREIDVNKNPGYALTGVGCLVDLPGFNYSHTPRQFFMSMGALIGLSHEETDSETKRILELMKMSQWADQKIKKFSKGMKQRISIGQVFMEEPEIMIFDEPMYGLDPLSAATVSDILEGMRRNGGRNTVLMATHNFSGIGTICDSVAVLNKGKLIAHSSLESFFSGKKLSEITVKTVLPFSKKDIDDLFSEKYVKDVITHDSGAKVTIEAGRMNKSCLVKKIIGMDVGVTEIVEENEMNKAYEEVLRRSENAD